MKTRTTKLVREPVFVKIAHLLAGYVVSEIISSEKNERQTEQHFTDERFQDCEFNKAVAVKRKRKMKTATKMKQSSES